MRHVNSVAARAAAGRSAGKRVAFDKLHLPYGVWTCADGREVMFNRHYRPIWCRWPGAAAVTADPTERVTWAHEEWVYGDARGPWDDTGIRADCVSLLLAWGLPEPSATRARPDLPF